MVLRKGGEGNGWGKEKGEGKVENEKKPDTAVPHRTPRTRRTQREGIPDVFNKPLRAKAARLGKRLGGGGKAIAVLCVCGFGADKPWTGD